MIGHPCTTLLVTVTGRDPLGAVEVDYRRAEPDIDAVLAVYLGEEPTDHEAARAGAKCACIGVDCGMITVTSQSYSRAAAAVSSPIQPAPTTTIRSPPQMAWRSRSEPSIWRRQCRRPGQPR
jgi:hypothetical protein